ncbi:apolipoprotein D and lipocalin family protein [Acinetobacter marinus]|uniref:Outer membrane lipoprotein Blc n=1 Tax=Acinetobacter marinus TaxID=281375 RepID=A0A1G6JNV1_9GAMM|nr:lipocalin family protein [Acinetobacter marinus]SDC19636.1 apolipoprotein D and lipocalin family protein [Acinetobacter marinus]
MSHNQSKPFSHLKLAVGAAALAGLGAGRLIWGMIPKKLDVAHYVDLHRFSGTWFEIARKPVSIERKSFHHITYEYHVVGENKLSTVLRYQTKEGRVIQLSGEAMVKNPPENSQYLVSYAPKMLKKRKKTNFWIMRLDNDYQVCLVGNKKRTRLWLFARQSNIDPRIVDDYLEFAREQGFDTDDLIFVDHNPQIAPSRIAVVR